MCVCVEVLVAESFEEVVNQPEKDVLVQFFSPRCPHCKKLSPVYTELAEQVCIPYIYTSTLSWLSRSISPISIPISNLFIRYIQIQFSLATVPVPKHMKVYLKVP